MKIRHFVPSGPRHSPRKNQFGLGLIEILVGIAISLFLLAGLATLFAGTRQNFDAQGHLAQLQDDQRMAMNMLSTVIQEAGYYPDPIVTVATTAFPADTVNPIIFASAGQIISGTSTTGASDTVSVRYRASAAGAALPDFIMDCNGGTNTSAAAKANYVSTFTVNANNELTCSVNGATARPLVGGISNLAVLYGVDKAGNGSVTQYLNATNMTSALWSSVISVRVTLTFINPLAGPTGQTATIPFTRIINLMGSS
jgi:type IV pilus assembly protein PilW